MIKVVKNKIMRMSDKFLLFRNFHGRSFSLSKKYPEAGIKARLMSAARLFLFRKDALVGTCK